VARPSRTEAHRFANERVTATLLPIQIGSN
jgi:hypothetical protein